MGYPKRYGQSQIAPMTIDRPGAFGLNTQDGSALLEPTWALEANNMVFDDNGRLSAREGWISTGQAPTEIITIFEYKPKNKDSNVVITATATRIYRGTTTLQDLTGTLTPTAGNWKFQNFNGKIVGVQDNHNPIVWDGQSASFEEIVPFSGTVPLGNEALSAYGRMWIPSLDGTVLHYSGLLDETDWGSASSGFIDLSTVWGIGLDRIVGLAAFNGFLVIFGSESVIIYGDSQGSPLGVNPLNIVVRDFIDNVGLYARDTVQSIGNDLVWLSRVGVLSLGRIIQEKSNPLSNLSENIRDSFLRNVLDNRPENISSTYNPVDDLYIISLITSGISYVFDMHGRLQDGTARVTTWNLAPNDWVYTEQDQQLLVQGIDVGTQGGFTDNGSSYEINWLGGWLDLGTNDSRLKILKNMSLVSFVQDSRPVTFEWGFDFSQSRISLTKNIATGITSSEYNEAEYGISEYGGGSVLEITKIPTKGAGQAIQVGIRTTINGAPFAIQRINLYSKIGRIL